jgi:UDP-glucose 4-epimerase
MNFNENSIMSGLNGKSVLVTGSTGYIAGRLLNFLSESECKILAITRKGSFESMGIYHISADTNRYDFWFDALQIVDTIILLGANTSLATAESNPIESLKSTLSPIINLIQASKAIKKIPKVIFTSTATVYGLTSTTPQSESSEINPITIYDLHKYYAEQYLRLATHNGEIEAVSLRLSNVYGPSENLSRAEDRGVLKKVANAALKGEPIKLFGNGDFLRDYIYIDDVVRAIIMTIICSKKLPNVMNLSSGKSYKVSEVFKQIVDGAIAITGIPVSLEMVNWPQKVSPIESRNYVADISLIRQELDWSPLVRIEDGIKLLLESSYRSST